MKDLIGEISLLRIEYNIYNGFIFHILNLEIGNFEGSLFGIFTAKNYLYIQVFFFTFKIINPFQGDL